MLLKLLNALLPERQWGPYSERQAIWIQRLEIGVIVSAVAIGVWIAARVFN